MRKPFPILLVLIVLLSSAPASAEVIQVMGFTSGRAVVGTPTLVSVDWRVSAASTSPDQSLAIISSEAFVTLEGDTADITAVRVPRPLKRLLPPPASAGVQTALFRENLPIPAELIDAALASGQRLIVVRAFRDQTNSTPVVGQVAVPLGGSNTAALNVSRVALYFPDGAQDKILPPAARSHVLAEISYTGTGRFDAVWEIAEPTSTLGEPLFRTLSAVHRNLLGGLQGLTLRSPALPTAMDGVHLLRLRIVTPSGFGAPVVQYYVNAALRPRPPQVRLFAYAPGEGAVYAPETRFHWSPITGAAVYQLEFFALSTPSILDRLPELGSLVGPDPHRDQPGDEGRYPLTGVMVTGFSSQASLSRLSLTHLTPGQTYEWRVTAYDAEGQLLGASALRSLVIPEGASVAPPLR